MLARYRRKKQISADEPLLDQPSDAVHINCTVAGVVVLLMVTGEKMPIQLAVGSTVLPYCIRGYTATGSSGTFTVFGMYG